MQNLLSTLGVLALTASVVACRCSDPHRSSDDSPRPGSTPGVEWPTPPGPAVPMAHPVVEPDPDAPAAAGPPPDEIEIDWPEPPEPEVPSEHPPADLDAAGPASAEGEE